MAADTRTVFRYPGPRSITSSTGASSAMTLIATSSLYALTATSGSRRIGLGPRDAPTIWSSRPERYCLSCTEIVYTIRRAVATRKGIVSFQVAQEFFNVALRRVAEPMTLGETEQYLATVFRPLMAVHSSQALYGAALR
jgi:hypothetical protein